jgi:hypothetical protein
LRLARTALLVALATQGACVPEEARSPAEGSELYRQYVVIDPANAASNDCFYACLRHPSKEEHETCFGQCEGVVASVTPDPCSPAITTPCTFDYEGPAPEVVAEDDDGDGLIGSIVGALVSAAFSSGDGGDSAGDDCDASPQRGHQRQVASRSASAEHRAPHVTPRVPPPARAPRPAPPARRYRAAKPSRGAK